MRLYSVGDAGLNEHEPMVEWRQGKTEILAQNMSQCYSVHHKSHGDWPGIQSPPPKKKKMKGKLMLNKEPHNESHIN